MTVSLASCLSLKQGVTSPLVLLVPPENVSKLSEFPHPARKGFLLVQSDKKTTASDVSDTKSRWCAPPERRATCAVSRHVRLGRLPFWCCVPSIVRSIRLSRRTDLFRGAFAAACIETPCSGRS